MHKPKPLISVILPCFNESQHFEISANKILAILKQLRKPFEIIFIDDCSTDATKILIQSFVKKHSLITRAVYHQNNQGRGATVVDGIQHATGTIVGFIDIDLEVGPQYISQFVAVIENGFDVACAYRHYRFSFAAIPRWVASTLYRKVSQYLFRHGLNDTEAGYKFFNKKKIVPILNKATDPHWFWDTEVMIYSYKVGLKITEIPVVFNRRLDKTSTVKLIPDTIDYIRKMIRLYLSIRREKIL